MEHLLNCHGEWLWLIQILAALPFAGVWLKVYFGHHHKDDDR